MAVTQNTYTGNGTTVLFSFTFPYLDTADIKVSLNGTVTTAYTLANATTVQMNAAPAVGAAIRIYRDTDIDDTSATFFPGSSIRSEDLNRNFDQVLYASQETRTFAESTDASAIQATANTALSNSSAAVTTANAAAATANGIAGTANTALSNSSAAVTTANAAQTTANGISATANTALGNAATAQTTANTAVTNAAAAQSTANAALPQTGGALTGNLTVPSLNGGPLAGFRNRIINGNFDFWQRGTSFAAIATDTYSLDRWLWQHLGAMVCTVSQSTDVPNNTFQSSYKVDVTTADTSIAAGDYANIIQAIEGYNVRDLIGTTFTLSFWVKSPKTGIHCVAFRNTATSNRSYVKEYTVVAANTWEYKTLTVIGGLITAGTWNWTNGNGLSVTFSLANGTTYQTTADAWQTGNFQSTANQVNLMDNTSNDFFLTGVQLEPGSVATPFEQRPIGTELALCQRYYENGGVVRGAPYVRPAGVATSDPNCFATVQFRVTKRVSPTMVGTGSFATLNSWIETSVDASTAYLTANNATGEAKVGSWNATAEL